MSWQQMDPGLANRVGHIDTLRKEAASFRMSRTGVEDPSHPKTNRSARFVKRTLARAAHSATARMASH